MFSPLRRFRHHVSSLFPSNRRLANSRRTVAFPRYRPTHSVEHLEARLLLTGGLTSVNDQRWHQEIAGVAGTGSDFERFGAAVATGDFNDDGFADLAIGISADIVNEIFRAGSVAIEYGTATGLAVPGNQLWNQDSSGIAGTAQVDDGFGTALAVGDFNNDGFDDLAIGVPGDPIDGAADAGSVNVIYGSSGGLTSAGSQFWHQNVANVKDVAEFGDRFGAALASGDFNHDGFADLAIGVPGEGVNGVPFAGGMAVFLGSASGLTTANDQFWNQDIDGVQDVAQVGDNFGGSLASGDFNSDGFDDIAIGVPGEQINEAPMAGAMHVVFGSASGLVVAGNQFWHQDISGVVDLAELQDQFAGSLATGDFDDDGFDDIAIGVPGEAINNVADAGAFHVLFGSATGPSTSHNQFWFEGVSGLPTIPELNDHFGRALGSGDFNADGFTDLAVGAPGKTLGGSLNGGQVSVLYGGISGLAPSGNQRWSQNTAGIKGIINENDQFGFALAAGDFNGDGADDLAIGVPGDLEVVGTFAIAMGAVNVLYGTATLTWHNSADPLDVNDDGEISPIDALLVINFLNANPGDGMLPEPIAPPPFLDVNNDGLGTALDALLVINELNRRAALLSPWNVAAAFAAVGENAEDRWSHPLEAIDLANAVPSADS